MCKWYDKKAGGLGLGITMIILYIGFKLAKTGITTWYLNMPFIWYSVWFVAIIISALATDLFENIESWTVNSLRIIENQASTKEERIEMIKTQLDIAVDRYMSVFLIINGFDSMFKKISQDVKNISKGVITVKELLVIFLYAVYDLVLRMGALTLVEPYDTLLILGGWVVLQIVDAKSGAAEIIAAMYSEAAEIKNIDVILNKITQYIKDLAHLYHLETIIPEVKIEELSDSEVKTLLLQIKQRQAKIS